MAIRKPLIIFALALGAYAAAVGVRVDAEMAQAVTGSTTTSMKTVWDGVYSVEQAARGKATYTTYCSECHEEDLAGGRGRPLSGSIFWRDWGEDTLDGLFNIMKTAMPRDNPASLTDNQYIDVTAYILEFNGLPPGREELKPEATSTIQVVGKDGPGPVPDFALVQVVGCLTERPDKSWALTKAAAPSRVRDPKPLPDASAFHSRALGDATFRLLSANPALLTPHRDRKVLIKGLLIRVPNDNRLNFTSVTMLSESCTS